jgi:hypothetical protein
MDFLSHPAFWIVVAASELIGLSPLKSNSVIQLVFQILNLIKPKRADPLRQNLRWSGTYHSPFAMGMGANAPGEDRRRTRQMAHQPAHKYCIAHHS